MQPLELPLFRTGTPLNATVTPNVLGDKIQITEDKFISPLANILDNITPKPIGAFPNENSSKSIGESLNALFPEQQREEKTIQKAKNILGDLTKEFTHDQLRDVISEIQYLTDSWLDDFERKIFKGLTLNELLHEKGSL